MAGRDLVPHNGSTQVSSFSERALQSHKGREFLEQAHLRGAEWQFKKGLALDAHQVLNELYLQQRDDLSSNAYEAHQLIEVFPEGPFQQEHAQMLEGQWKRSAQADERIFTALESAAIDLIGRPFAYTNKKWYEPS